MAFVAFRGVVGVVVFGFSGILLVVDCFQVVLKLIDNLLLGVEDVTILIVPCDGSLTRFLRVDRFRVINGVISTFLD